MIFKRLIGFTFKSPVITGLVTFLISLILTQLITYRDFQLKKGIEQQLVIQEASLLEKKINTILNQAYAAASTLQIAHELMKDDLDALNSKSADLLKMFPALDIVQIVEGGNIIYVYPLRGNEVVIGYNILDDPKTAREAALAIERKCFLPGLLNFAKEVKELLVDCQYLKTISFGDLAL